MNETESDSRVEANAAYRLGRDRFTIRMWQEFAWTCNVGDESVKQGVSLSVEDLLHWLEDLNDLIDPLAALDIKLWSSRFSLKWSAYYESEDHIHDINGGGLAPTASLLARNPFHSDLQDLVRITDKADLLQSGRGDLAKWFRVGSIVGRCECLLWVDSPSEDDALALLSQNEELPPEIRAGALEVLKLPSTIRFNELMRLQQSVVNLINGGIDDLDPRDYVLVLITNPQTVYFLGNRITTQLKPYEFRLLKAFANHPGQPLAWEKLTVLIDTETDENNLRRYMSRVLQKIAKDSCSPDEYKSFRNRLKEEFFPTEKETGYYKLNVEPSRVLVTERLHGGN